MARPRVVSPGVETDGADEFEVPAEDERDIGDLAALAEAQQDWRWQVHRVKSQDEMARNPRGRPRVWVTTLHGAVDLADFHSRHGGGVYEFWGSHDGKLRTKVSVELDGAPKSPADVVTSPPAAPAPVVHQNGDRLTRKLIRRMIRIEQRLAQPPPAPPPQSEIKDLVGALVSLDTLRAKYQPEPQSSDPMALFKVMMEMVNKGIAIGQQREPIETDDEGQPKWLEMIASVAERVLSRPQVPPQRPARPVSTAGAGPVAPPPGPAAPTPPPPPDSRAEVVTESGVTEAPVMQMTAARMMVLVDKLARSVRDRDPVEETADAVCEILPEDELASILSLPDEAVVADLATRASGQYPELGTPEGRKYLGDVLAEIRNPSIESE